MQEEELQYKWSRYFESSTVLNQSRLEKLLHNFLRGVLLRVRLVPNSLSVHFPGNIIRQILSIVDCKTCRPNCDDCKCNDRIPDISVT